MGFVFAGGAGIRSFNEDTSESTPTGAYRGYNVANKTPWYELISTEENNAPIHGFWLQTHPFYTTTQDHHTMIVDLAVGDAGNENIIYTNLVCNVDPGYTKINSLYYPLTLPAHKRISWRFASNHDENDYTPWRCGLLIKPIRGNAHDLPTGLCKNEVINLNTSTWEGTNTFLNTTASTWSANQYIGAPSFRWQYMRIWSGSDGSCSDLWCQWHFGYSQPGNSPVWFYTHIDSFDSNRTSHSGRELIPVNLTKGIGLVARMKSESGLTSSWQTDKVLLVEGYG